MVFCFVLECIFCTFRNDINCHKDSFSEVWSQVSLRLKVLETSNMWNVSDIFVVVTSIEEIAVVAFFNILKAIMWYSRRFDLNLSHLLSVYCKNFTSPGAHVSITSTANAPWLVSVLGSCLYKNDESQMVPWNWNLYICDLVYLWHQRWPDREKP